MNKEKISFRRMMFTMGRLERIEQVVADDDQFVDEKIRSRTNIREFIFIQVSLLS